MVGPELVRVKDLARRCNAPTLSDYTDALKVLKRIFKRRESAILFKRGYAGRDLIPSQVRPDPPITSLASTVSPRAVSPPGHLTQEDVLDYFDSRQAAYDIHAVVLPTSTRFVTLAYTDASFAVGESKDSISGFVIFVNGTPVMWGSMRQTSVADSTCAAEFVATSVCCKQLVHVENMFHFLGVACPKPYTVYTDSQASQHISMNSQKLGKVRHIAIRYHLVRGMSSAGDIVLIYFVTEDMVADVFTKIMSGAAFDRLASRFYFHGL